MKNLILSAALLLGCTYANAQWTIGKPLTIVNNTSLNYHYVINHHSAFYDGTNDGIINGLYGPFNMNTLNSNWNKDIIEGTICGDAVTLSNSITEYKLPLVGLPVKDYVIHPNSNVSNKNDFGLYFRTYYLKGELFSSAVTVAFAVKYPAPPTAGLTPIAGTTYSYNTSSSMLYETSGSFQSFFFTPQGSVPGTTNGFIVQFTEVSGTEYVVCNQI